MQKPKMLYAGLREEFGGMYWTVTSVDHANRQTDRQTFLSHVQVQYGEILFFTYPIFLRSCGQCTGSHGRMVLLEQRGLKLRGIGGWGLNSLPSN